MTTASPIPATEAAPRMTDPPDTEAQARPAAQTSAVRPRLRDQIAENPLLTLFGTIIIALLVFGLGTINFRFDDVHARIDDTNHRIDRLEDAMLALDAKIDEKFGELDAKFDEMNLKLTALIAHLNATAAVDAALDGQLTGSDETDEEPLAISP